MFPSMYRTLHDVADARILNASSCEHEDGLRTRANARPSNAGWLKRRRSLSAQWNVKFRPLIRAVTPEQAGMSTTNCFYMNVLKVEVAFAGDKSDRSMFAIGDGNKLLYKSSEQKGVRSVWTEQLLRQQKFPYDDSAQMTFALYRTAKGSWRKQDKELPVLTGAMRLLEIANAGTETRTVKLTEAKTANQSEKDSAEAALLRITLEPSQPAIQPFLLWVPIKKLDVVPPMLWTRKSSTEVVSPTVSHRRMSSEMEVPPLGAEARRLLIPCTKDDAVTDALRLANSTQVDTISWS